MNLETSRTYDKLNEIGVELSLYSKYLHEALLTKFISDRLEASLRYYEIELDKSTSFLSTRYGSEMLRSIAAKSRKANKKEILTEVVFEEDINND